MVYLATLLLLLEACSFSGAASIYSPRRSKKSFTLEQIPTSRTRARRSTPDDHGSVSAADISKDNEYIVPVTIGGSTLNLQLDTGSSDLWVFSNETKSAKGHTYYKPGKHAQKIENGTWDISYSDNDFCFGDVWLDSVTIGGLTYDKQGVEAAKIASPGLVADRDSDGILGLSFSDENTAIPKQKNFFANIIDELEEPVFTASLKHNAPGSYDFGFIDKSKYTGEIKYVDVNRTNEHWNFRMDTMSASNSTLASDLDVIADTGTTLLIFHEDVVRNYVSQVNSSSTPVTFREGSYYVDCDADLPDLTLHINGYNAVIPGHLTKVSAPDGQCYTALQSRGLGPGLNVLGDVFFKAQFVVFKMDRDEKHAQLGFAPQAK